MTIADQAAQQIGEQILEAVRSAAPTQNGIATASPSEIARMVHAFLQIDDQRLRTDFVSLIEAIATLRR